jgi:hypothetical protein
MGGRLFIVGRSELDSGPSAHADVRRLRRSSLPPFLRFVILTPVC